MGSVLAEWGDGNWKASSERHLGGTLDAERFDCFRKANKNPEGGLAEIARDGNSAVRRWPGAQQLLREEIKNLHAGREFDLGSVREEYSLVDFSGEEAHERVAGQSGRAHEAREEEIAREGVARFACGSRLNEHPVFRWPCVRKKDLLQFPADQWRGSPQLALHVCAGRVEWGLDAPPVECIRECPEVQIDLPASLQA